MPAGIKYLLIAVLVYLGYCCLLFLLQRQIMFPRYMIPTPSASAPRIRATASFLVSASRSLVGLRKLWELPVVEVLWR